MAHMRAISLAGMLLASISLAARAERFSIIDKGGFGNTGRFIELPDRYGWDSYEIKYDLSVDLGSRRLDDDAKLEITIKKKDGDLWRYRCRPSASRRLMWANVNTLMGAGVSVLTECRVDPRRFSYAVDLDPDQVGFPTIVFHARIVNGRAEAGIHKGLYFVKGEGMEAGPMLPYSISDPDPTDLGVLFKSQAPLALQAGSGETDGVVR
jgi:hypothetical protein